MTTAGFEAMVVVDWGLCPLGSGEGVGRVQQLRTLSAFIDAQVSVPSNPQLLTTTCYSVPVKFLPCFGLHGHQAQTCYADMQANIHTHKIKINIRRNSLKNNFSICNLKGIKPKAFRVCVTHGVRRQPVQAGSSFYYEHQESNSGRCLEAFLLHPSPCLPSESILTVENHQTAIRHGENWLYKMPHLHITTFS